MGVVKIRLEPPLSFIQAQSGAFRAALDDLEPLWDRFSIILSSLGESRWQTEGFGEWPELADSTVKDKMRHSWPPFPLVRTGELAESLQNPDLAMGDVGPQSFTWGSDIPYAEYHQDGTPRMPKRKILEIRTEDRRAFERAQVSWINQVAADTWGKT